MDASYAKLTESKQNTACRFTFQELRGQANAKCCSEEEEGEEEGCHWGGGASAAHGRPRAAFSARRHNMAEVIFLVQAGICLSVRDKESRGRRKCSGVCGREGGGALPVASVEMRGGGDAPVARWRTLVAFPLLLRGPYGPSLSHQGTQLAETLVSNEIQTKTVFFSLNRSTGGGGLGGFHPGATSEM